MTEKLTKNDWYEKYKSNIYYFTNKAKNGFDFQKKISKISVCILGLGGGGFSILSHLVSLGVKKIHVVDYDKIELSNLNRQSFWNMKDLNKYKVDVAKEFVLARNDNIKFTKSVKKIISVKDVEIEIKGFDWVFCCMDEPPYVSQRTVNRGCVNLNIKSVYPFCQNENGRFFIIDPKKACIDCLFNKIADDGLINMISSLKKASFNSITSATSYTIQFFCSWIINEWVKCLINDNEIRPLIKRIDFVDYKVSEVVSWEKWNNCITCGLKTGISNNSNFLTFEKLVSIE